LWLPLLHSLNDVPSWIVFKNAESAFDGYGNIDSLAAHRHHSEITQRFVTWARDLGLGPIVSCSHRFGGPKLVVADGATSSLLMLDVLRERPFRGSPLLTVQMAHQLAVESDWGFRRVRPGSEGMTKLLLNAMRRNGQPNQNALIQKCIPQLIKNDFQGVSEMAGLFPVIQTPLMRLARAASLLAWDRTSANAIQTWFGMRSLGYPDIAAGRIWHQNGTPAACPLRRLKGRRIPAAIDSGEWLTRVAAMRGHEIIG
jgi:hypothetical protein